MFDFDLESFCCRKHERTYCTLFIPNTRTNFMLSRTSNFVITDFSENLWQLTKWSWFICFFHFNESIRQGTWNFVLKFFPSHSPTTLHCQVEVRRWLQKSQGKSIINFSFFAFPFTLREKKTRARSLARRYFPSCQIIYTTMCTWAFSKHCILFLFLGFLGILKLLIWRKANEENIEIYINKIRDF